MSFDLGRFLQGAVAEINPWDNGANFNSVYNPKKKKQVQQPTQTFRPQAGASPVMQSDAREVQRQRAKEHMAQIDANIRKTRSEIMSPLSVLSDVGKATGQVAGAIGKGVSDFATGTAQEYNKRANDVGSAAATVIREATGQNQAYDQHMRDLASNANQTDINLMKRLKVETDPARRAALNRALHINAGGTANRFLQDMQKQNLAATDPRKTLVNAANSALDVVTLGKGKAIMDGIKAGERLTMPVARQLAKNTALSGAQGAGIGAAYGGVNTAIDPNASPLDYARNMGQGAAMGAAVGIGAQVALPVAGVAANKAIRTTRTAANYVANASVEVPRVVVRKQAAQHPEVLGHDAEYQTIQRAWENSSDPVARRGYAKAMAENRAARLATQRRIENKMLQGGYLGGPQALGFNDAKKAGQVFDGVDGKPRFEVDDSGAKIKNPNGKTLGEVLDHPELFKNYPDLTNIKTTFNESRGIAGAYNPNGDSLNLSDKNDLRTLLHETQHAIQTREGFDNGTTIVTGEQVQKVTSAIRKSDANIKEIDSVLRQVKQATKGKKLVGEARAKVDELKRLRENAIVIRKKQTEVAKKLYSEVKTVDEYKNNLGEAEARAVEARMNMPMSERYVKGETLYHGSPVADTIRKEGFKTGIRRPGVREPVFGDGVYLTNKLDAAAGYGNKDAANVITTHLPDDIRLADVTADDAFKPKVIERLKKKGYDGVRHRDTNEDYLNVFNPKRVNMGEAKPRSTFYDSLDVPKDDLIIRNGDGKAMSIEPKDPLAQLKQEALKYKSAEEFVKNTDHTPQTTRVYIKSKFRDGGGYADVPVIREEKNITLYQGGTGENRQFWTPNKEYAKKFGNGEVVKKTGNFYQIDNGNRMTDVYVDADKQLTDLYNQAHAQSAPVRLSGLDGKPIETDGKNVILYHRTSPESAKNIQKAGYLDPMKAGTGNDRAITQDGKVSYLTTNPSQDFYGESVVKVKMPIEEFKRQIENNKAIVAKLEEELATGKVPEIYRQDTLRMIENIKANPEILSSKPLSITESAPVKTTGASDNKINTLEQKPQETQAQLKDTSNTEVQAGKIQNPSPYKGDYTTKAAENKPEDPLAIVDELFPSNKPVPKQRLTKAERQEVDAIIHEQDPNLLYRTSNFDKQKLTESSDNKLPRIHVNDLKRYFGNTENIPAKYKRTTGREDLDLLAQRAGYDDVDKFMQDFEGELDSRAQLRADTELLKEFRNDPETIKLARERIAARKAAEPKQIKVKGSQPTKNVPVTQVRRTGDVVTTSNVNPNLKSLSEKRYSVADDGELMPDKKGATSVFTDKDGRVQHIRIGDTVYGKKDFGDLSDVNGYASTLATMRRNVERGFGKETGDKLSRFLVDHQQDQATKMVERKLIENQGMKELAQDLGINFKTGSKNAKKVSAAIQDFGEGVRDKASLVDEFGQEQANKIVAADKWFRKQYDTLLNEANKTLTQYGYDPIPKRKNYYTHFQDESVWKKFGLRMDDVRRTLGDPTLQDAMPDAPRGKIDNKLAGQSEFTQPGKRFNRFALQRKGNQHTADAFQAFERYLEPTLNNIYMTPSISRARVISRAVAQDANVMGKDANGLLIQMKEWANDLAGKSNRFDRPLVDSNWGSKAIKTSQWLQKKAGQNTIVGNLSTAVMQPIVLAQTAGKFGYKNTALGLMRAAGKDSVEMTQSKFLKRRYSNLRSVTETKMDSARHAANVPLEVIEETATKSTWEAAYLDAKDKGLAGKEAIRYADVETEKTVAGRSIGEKPEIFRSKAAGFMTQYQLEVSNYWQQLGKEMSKKQALKVFVAAYGINSLLQATTGRRVGFDPISAAIDMYQESQKDEKSTPDKLKSAGQRAIGEVADNLPFVPMVASTVMGQKNYQKLLGPDSQGGRFGVSSPISTVASNPLFLVSPFGGSQVKKTTQGAQVLAAGEMKDKQGKTVVNVPQTPANIARGLLFGPSAIPEVNQYYNNISKKKVDQKPVPNQVGSVAGTQSLKGFTLAQQKDLQSISGPARDTVAAKFLAENKARRAEDAKKKTMTPEQKKSYSSDKRIDGYIADNVSKNTTSTLTKYYTMKPKDREAWFAKESDAEYKYEKAKYENDKANGSISKIEDIKRTRELKQSEIGSKYSKDARELYRLNKAQIYDYVTKSKDGKKLAEQLLAYDQALYNAGLSKYLKFKTGLAPSARGGGRGGKGRKSAGFKLPTTSVSNKAAKETLAELSRLLAGTTAKNQIPKQIGRKVALKKITVKG